MRALRILILVWPESSVYNATLPLARVLRQRGCGVVYAVPAQWAGDVSRQGFETVLLDPSVPVLAGPARRWRVSAIRHQAARGIDDLCESLSRLGIERFHLVLLHPTLWYYALALRRLGISYLAANTCLALISNPDLPPVFSGLRPLTARPALNRLRCAAAWLLLRYLGAFNHRYHGIMQPRSTGPFTLARDVVVAARHIVRSLLEPFFMPVYHSALHTARRSGVTVRWGDYGYRIAGTELVFGPKAADFPVHRRSWRRVYVGACVDTDRVEDSFDWTWLDTSKPLVYCALGSHAGYWNEKNRRRLIVSVVEAFRVSPEYQLLLQTARADECVPPGPLPHNIHRAPWLPQLQALARASLLITHGGFSTIREALYFGVPMIVFPFGVDQPGNAARVTWLHAGLVGDIRSVTAGAINSMLREVGKASYRESVLELREVLRADTGCDEAVTVIGAAAERAAAARSPYGSSLKFGM